MEMLVKHGTEVSFPLCETCSWPHWNQESAPATGFGAGSTSAIHSGHLFPSIPLQHPPVWLHLCLSLSFLEKSTRSGSLSTHLCPMG